MKTIRSRLAEHRAITFVVITFALTWSYEFAVVYPLITGDVSTGLDLQGSIAIAMAMFFPAIGVVITRLITGDGFRRCVIKPYRLKRSFPWFVVAWFGPSVFIVLGAAIYFLVFPESFDPDGTQFLGYLQAQIESTGANTELPMSLPVLAVFQLAIGTLLGPVLNFVTCFGEEWGWRGYLLPKLGHKLSIVPTLLLTGLIWGLWHAPITALGHNYGLGYPGWPVTGILAMCCFCTVVGIFLSYVTLRTGSCLAATFGHGAINAVGGCATIFAVAGASPFVGPASTGIIGGIGFIIVAALMLVDLKRREDRGELVIPVAGSQD